MRNLFLAILPTIIIATYILSYDRYNPEPRSLCIKLFFFGCVTTIPAIFLERIYPVGIIYDYGHLFLYNLTGIALIEEGVKYICTIAIAYKHRAFDEIYDGIIYCVMVSLGFATVENIMYVSSYGTSTAVFRMLTAVPAHAIFAVTMGYYLGLSKAFPAKRIWYLLLSLAVPTLLHGCYDFILDTEFYWTVIVFVVYLFYLYKKMFALVRQTSDVTPFR